MSAASEMLLHSQTTNTNEPIRTPDRLVGDFLITMPEPAALSKFLLTAERKLGAVVPYAAMEEFRRMRPNTSGAMKLVGPIGDIAICLQEYLTGMFERIDVAELKQVQPHSHRQHVHRAAAASPKLVSPVPNSVTRPHDKMTVVGDVVIHSNSDSDAPPQLPPQTVSAAPALQPPIIVALPEEWAKIERNNTDDKRKMYRNRTVWYDPKDGVIQGLSKAGVPPDASWPRGLRKVLLDHEGKIATRSGKACSGRQQTPTSPSPKNIRNNRYWWI
jgi:hypothetical protein